MKKLVLMFVAIAAISFASCGNKTAPAVEEEEAVEVVDTDSIAADSIATDSVEVAPAEEAAE